MPTNEIRKVSHSVRLRELETRFYTAPVFEGFCIKGNYSEMPTSSSFAKLNIRFALLKDAESDVRLNFLCTKEKQQDAMKF